MAQQYDDKLTGVFFEEEKASENHPDYKGRCQMEDGKKYWMSVWINESAKGNRYFKVRFAPMQEAPERPQEEEPAAATPF
jgi:hypothetical protein